MSNLTSIVQNVIDECDGNWDEAVSRLSNMLETDTELFNDYVRPMIWDFARTKVYSIGRSRKNYLFETAGKPKSNKKAKSEEPSYVSEVVSSKAKSSSKKKGRSGEEDHKGALGDKGVMWDNIQRYLDDYWLNNCKKTLGDANKADLDMEYEESMRHAKGNYERARWYAEMRDNLADDRIVREVFTPDDIESLIVKVKQDVSNHLETLEPDPAA